MSLADGIAWEKEFGFWDEIKKEEENPMKTIVLKVDQNGGEYHGHVFIKAKGDDFSFDGSRTIVVDGVEIKFDEYVQIQSIK